MFRENTIIELYVHDGTSLVTRDRQELIELNNNQRSSEVIIGYAEH